MISGAAVQINHCWTVLGRIEMPNSIVVPAWQSLRSNIWDVKPILQSLWVFFFFHWKISLNLNPSSISAILSMQMAFWSLIIIVPFFPPSLLKKWSLMWVKSPPVQVFLGSGNALTRNEGTEMEKQFHLDGSIKEVLSE